MSLRKMLKAHARSSKNGVGVKALTEALQEIDAVKRTYRLSAEHMRWRTNTLLLMKEIFGDDSLLYSNFASLKFRATSDFITYGYENVNNIIRQKMHEGFLEDMETARGILQAAIDQIKQKGIKNVFEGDQTKASSDIVRILSLVDNSLRKVIRSVPEKETEVQDALENLFVGAGLDFLREKENITYSSKTYVPDFVFNRIDTVVEVKLCGHKDREKEIIAEINAHYGDG